MTVRGPVSARTDTFVRPVREVAFADVRFMFVRHGSAIVSGPHGSEVVAAGDVMVLAPNVLLGGCPEGAVTITTVLADLDYLLDQTYWQYAGCVADVFHVAEILDATFPDPVRLFTPSEARMGLLSPWLDGLVEATIAGLQASGFFRMQADLASIFNVLTPYLSLDPTGPARRSRISVNERVRRRRFRPLRHEARQMHRLLEGGIAEQWTLARLAESTHLSQAQAHRLFLDAYGFTPLAYQSRLRVREMARLLRTTGLTVDEIARQVGWHDRSHAAKVFRRRTGLTPREYRSQGDTTTR